MTSAGDLRPALFTTEARISRRTHGEVKGAFEMTADEYRAKFHEEQAVGWEAMDEEVSAVYPGQEPQHWGTIISHMLGGPDPLDGISAYECSDGGVDHWHFVTYGYSTLYYEPEAAGGDESGYGFEMTFRLKRTGPDQNLVWVCGLLQNLARYVFESGNHFADGHWVPANGPIRTDVDTALVGLLFLRDPTIRPAMTPHGQVDFVQAFGITQAELNELQAETATARDIIERHQPANRLLVTDLDRS